MCITEDSKKDKNAIYCLQIFTSVLERFKLDKHVVPENIDYTSPMKGVFAKNAPPTYSPPELGFSYFFTFFGLSDPPNPSKFQSLLSREYAMDIFCNSTMCKICKLKTGDIIDSTQYYIKHINRAMSVNF